MSWMCKLPALVSDWIRCERGSTLPIVGACAFVLIGAVGSAVDIRRLQVTKSKLRTALDAAGLAAGSMLNTTNLEDEVEKYLEANFEGQTVDAEVIDFDVSTNADETKIFVSATAQLPATFMQVFGHDQLQVTAETEITREMKGMEVALVLDATGSMCSPCSKIEALMEAATDMVNILFGDAATLDDLWIGIVPFSQSVNVGTNRTPWRNAAHFAGLNYFFANHTWSGCFEERYGVNNRDVTDDPPSVELFRTYFFPDTNPDSGSQNSWRGNFGQNRVNASIDRWANKGCPTAVLTPLTNVKQTLLDNIELLDDPRGNTHINAGAVWGWRLLSPQWRGQWGGLMDTNNLPLDYHAELSQKAVVLMTDGVNTMSSQIYTAYGFLSAGNLGTTNANTAVTKLNNKTKQVCASMKAQGILIYTILFMEDDPAAIDVMQTCASQPDFFFNSPDEDTLKQAFNAIGDSLSELRVSK
jgi:Flp pilus assembly protein TadG